VAAREPFTVRLPADLIAAVRTRARDAGAAGAGELVEPALRLWLSTSQANAQRAALLGEVEEVLLTQMDKRLGRAVEGLRDIVAKASFDQSLTFLLVRETLRLLFEDDKQAFEKLLQGAREGAARRLKRPSVVTPDVETEAMKQLGSKLEDLQRSLADVTKQLEDWQRYSRAVEAERSYWHDLAGWERGRLSWARAQLQAHKPSLLGPKKTLEGLLEEYDQAVAPPVKEEPHE